MTLVEALRHFLWSFRLPGEAQKIDRMMEAFAQHYCAVNEGVFNSTDTCYVLSFSVIMLNTSLHNPSVKNKPTLESFIQMNRGLDNGADLQAELLTTLYESISKEPFKIPEDDGSDLTQTFFNPGRQGWLTKEGGKHRSWKKRWFLLTDNCLYYFKSPQHKEPKGIVPLELLQVRDAVEVKKPHCFEIYSNDGLIKACKLDSDGKVVEGHHSTYRICADSEDDKDEWVKCIKASISRDPFYEMLHQRKKKAQKGN
jgi:cytohesin